MKVMCQHCLMHCIQLQCKHKHIIRCTSGDLRMIDVWTMLQVQVDSRWMLGSAKDFNHGLPPVLVNFQLIVMPRNCQTQWNGRKTSLRCQYWKELHAIYYTHRTYTQTQAIGDTVCSESPRADGPACNYMSTVSKAVSCSGFGFRPE